MSSINFLMACQESSFSLENLFYYLYQILRCIALTLVLWLCCFIPAIADGTLTLNHSLPEMREQEVSGTGTGCPKCRRKRQQQGYEKDAMEAEWDCDSCFLPAGRVDVDAFRFELLNSHNQCRRLHDSEPLLTLPELEEGAQQWAEHLANKGYLQYAEHLHNIGENIAVIELSKEVLSGKQVSRNWYREIKHYSFSESVWRRGAFHLTQMLWRSSTHIGIGLARTPGESKLFLVVRYFPAGNSNMPGEFYKNVLPRISMPSRSSLSSSSWNTEDFSPMVKSFPSLVRLRSFTSAAEDAFI